MLGFNLSNEAMVDIQHSGFPHTALRHALSGQALLLGVALLLGCRSSLPLAHLACPPPEYPRCTASPWRGAPRDTVPRTDRPYWTLRAVEGLSRVGIDELALTPLPDHRLWVTLAQDHRQWVASATLLDEAHARIETEWQFDEFTCIGFPAGKPEQLLLAGEAFGTSGVGIFTAQLHGNVLRKGSAVHWTELAPVWASQPALSPQGSVVFFAADLAESYGGTDIYFAVRRSDGTWAGPYNCGPQINSACHELTPWITPDGRWILFASNGHSSVGGYDVFAAPIHPGFWEWIARGMPPLPSDVPLLQPWFGEAHNLGIPINTSADELAPVAFGEPDSLLYWSSNRRGDFDLYVLRRHEALASPLGPASSLQTIEIRGSVHHQETRNPIPGAEVRAHRPGERTPIAETTTDEAGRYRLRVPANTELELIAQAGEVFFQIQRITTPSTDTTLPPLELPARFFLRINFPFDRYDTPYPLVLDTNGRETSLRWEQVLDQLADNILRYRDRLQQLVLVGHTDDIGSAEYNRWLGHKRVNFIIEQLWRRGVPRELLRGESAGQSQLLPRLPNEPIEQWRKRCRRVELSKVLRTP